MADVVGRAVLTITGQLDKASLRAVGKDAESTLGKIGKTAARAGLAAGAALAGGIATAGVAGVKLAADFESSMKQIQVLAGVPANQIDALGDSIRDIGAAAGIAPIEAADAFFFLQSGIGDTEVALEALDAATKGAAVGLGTVEELSQASVSVISAYGSELFSAEQALNVFGEAAKASTLGPDQLASGLQGAIPAAAQMGVSLEDLAGVMATISPAFSSGAEAGTTLEAALRAIRAPTAEAQKIMGELGLTSEELAQTASEQGLSGALKLLGETADGDAIALQRMLGSSEAADAAIAFLGKSAQGTATELDKNAKNAGFLADGFDEVSKTGAVQFSQAMAEAKNILIDFGQFLTPVLLPALGAFRDAMSRLSGASGDIAGVLRQIKDAAVDAFNSDVIQDLISAVQDFGDSAAAAFETLEPIISDVISALAPILGGAVLLAIEGITQAFEIMGPVIEFVADTIATFVEVLTNPAVQAALAAIATGLTVAFAPAVARIVLFNAQMAIAVVRMAAVSAATAIWTGVQTLLNVVLTANPIGLIVVAIAALVAGIVVAYKRSETFRDIVDGAFKVVKNSAQAVADFFTKQIPKAFNAVSNAAKSVLNFVRNNWPKILAVLTGPIGLAVLAVVSNFDKIKSAARSVKDFVVGRFQDIVGFIASIPGRIRDLGSKMLDAGKSIMGKLFDGLRSVGDIGASIGRNIWNGIRGGINAAIQGVNDFLPDKIVLKGLPDIDLPNNPIPQIPAFAHGTDFAPGGLSLVGEDGPELVNLPRGSRVHTASETSALARDISSTSSVKITNVFTGPTTSGGRLSEMEWTLRYATIGRGEVIAGVPT